MPAQEKLSQTEQYFAYIAGLGIVVIMAALILIGLGTFDEDDVPVSLLLIGLALLVIGVAGWMYMIKPWAKFDDLKTPLYTGHAPDAPPVRTEPADLPMVADEPKAITPVPDEPKAIKPVAPEIQAAPPVSVAEAPAIELPAPGQPLVAEAGAPESAASPVPDTAAVSASEALVSTAADDLVVIEGIGPKCAAALRDAGVTTFAQVAQMSPAELEQIVRERKVRLVGSTATWPEQAALAAQGDMNALGTLQARLKSGRASK